MLGSPNSALSGASRDLAPHPQPAFPKSNTISLSLCSAPLPLPEPAITSNFTEETVAKEVVHLLKLSSPCLLGKKEVSPAQGQHASLCGGMLHPLVPFERVPLSQLHPFCWVLGYNFILYLFPAHTCLLPSPTCFSLLCCRVLRTQLSSTPRTPFISPGAISFPRVPHSWTFYSIAMPSAAASACPHC